MSRALPRRLIALALALLSLIALAACGAIADPQAIPKASTLMRPVVDMTGTLSDSDIDAISKAADNNAKNHTSPQVAVLMVGSLPGGDTGEQASLKAARAWGIGGKGMKNGVLFYIAKDDHEMRLEVADGVGDRLTDLESDRILDDHVKPLFKKDRYAEGIETGVKLVRAEIGGRPGTTHVGSGRKSADAADKAKAPNIFVGILSFVLLFALLFFILPFILLFGGSSSSSSSSSSSGSSFGGGGGFSGGGASSGW